jgi:hypothetical protein
LLAPLSSSRRTTSRWPCWAATCRGELLLCGGECVAEAQVRLVKLPIPVLSTHPPQLFPFSALFQLTEYSLQLRMLASTCLVGCILVSTLVQQQANHPHVTILACNIERGPPILQSRNAMSVNARPWLTVLLPEFSRSLPSVLLPAHLFIHSRHLALAGDCGAARQLRGPVHQCTHIVGCVFVSAPVQQQAHHIQVTQLGCYVEGRGLGLRWRV